MLLLLGSPAGDAAGEQKTVLNVPMISSPKSKTCVLSIIAKLEGVNDISLDVEKGQTTIIGTADPALAVTALRKAFCGKAAAVTIHTVEAYKKPDPPKPNPPKPEPPKPCKPEPCNGPPSCYPVTIDMLVVPSDEPNTVRTIL